MAPRITNTTFNSRTVTIQFSEPVQAATVNRTNITLTRVAFPSNVLLNSDPRLTVTYDASKNQAIIDLSNLPQTLLLSGTYQLLVSDAVKDLVGNSLDGEFFPNKNVFPSGNGTAGGVFTQQFAATLRAPIIASLSLEQTNTSDSQILGDLNTQNARPWFTGSVKSLFPQATSGLQVAVSFSGLHGGTSDLALGFDGRGFVGTNDLNSTVVTTDANGNFRFQRRATWPKATSSCGLWSSAPTMWPPCRASPRRSIRGSARITPRRRSRAWVRCRCRAPIRSDRSPSRSPILRSPARVPFRRRPPSAIRPSTRPPWPTSATTGW
ncbi:MAG: Ig-like domain-containing protein [Isosphaeraceae bacterium]